MVVAVMADKAIDAMLAQLAGCASHVVLTRTRGRRAADPLALAARATRLAPDVPIEVQPAIDGALAAAWGHGPMICVAGSIFLVGEVLEWLEPMG
jgi:folylpolyglutamate synthase/dihydropteroate synthase